jgi:uncharacterized membrane protein
LFRRYSLDHRNETPIMSEEQGRFTKGRLEAFSDGVIAVIITIMVLDLKAPDNDHVEDLLKLWPSFASYLISFLFGAIYWINHHNVIALAKRITPGLIWANNLLLFFLSLFPFSTAYMAANGLSPRATMVYGAVQFACAVAFSVLAAIVSGQHKGDLAFEEREHAAAWKHTTTQVLYFLAIPTAYFSPIVAILIFGGIGLIYTVPSLLAYRKA